MGQAAKALAVGQTILTTLAFLLSCAPATAGERGNGARGERERDAILHGTRLYEVTETVHFGGDGLHVVTRDAVAVLMGFAPLGTPLCPMKALITNPTAQTCTVTGTGQDSVSAGGDSVDGKGPVSGTFAVVVNAPGNSSVHVPDLPLLTGTFSGVNDLSPAILHGIPLGSIRGTFKIDGDPQEVPFTGTFRLPFALDRHGRVKEPDDEREETFYLGDDGELIRVRPFERVLGFPPVRLELKF
jgi:hypothetical protein